MIHEYDGEPAAPLSPAYGALLDQEGAMHLVADGRPWARAAVAEIGDALGKTSESMNPDARRRRHGARAA